MDGISRAPETTIYPEWYVENFYFAEASDSNANNGPP